MKKEAVSVLKPHNGKTFKSKVNKKPKENAAKIEKRVVVAEPRGAQKAKIVNIQKVDLSDTLKKLKNIKSAIVDRPKTESLVKINGNETKKVADQAAVGKMAAVRKNRSETRVQPTKKLKTQSDEPTAAVKSQKNIVKIPAQETPQVEPELATKATKKPKSKVMKRKTIENSGDLKMTKKHVLQSIRSIQQLSQKREESKKSLLPMESNPLLLQVNCIKIAKTPRRQIRPYLPHSLAGPLDDVALFVPDLERGRRKDYEKTVDHWETKLREQGIDRIKEIIPINRVKTEFNQYELQRKLAMSFDYFLADGRICGHLTHLLGKAFFKRKSAPTPVKLGRDNLKGELNFALRKTCMEVHPYGNSHAMQVGTISMDSTKLAENVWAACEEIAKEYPGGWENVRSIRLKTNTGPAIPIYMSLVSKNNVPIPVVKPKRPRAYETVKGELTTVLGGARVKLTPEGSIRVKRLKDYGEREEKEEIKEESKSEKEKSDEEEDDEQ